MQDDIQQQILGAILLVLRPLVRAMLRVGVGYREFSELAKNAFVETATEDYGLRGRPTNISRVAVMTGLTRKEVRRIRQKANYAHHTIAMKTAPMSQVLHRWYTDHEFLTEAGNPKSLSFDGEGVTFTSLVRKYAGDVPPGAMRTELSRIHAITIDERGTLLPAKRIAYSTELHDRFISGLAGIIYPAALNFSHNIESVDLTKRWPNLAATSKFVREEDRGRIARISSDRIEEFIEAIDDIYAAYETLYDIEDHKDQNCAVGVGVFYFEEDKSASNIF
jgi:hypothetical protein